MKNRNQRKAPPGANGTARNESHSTVSLATNGAQVAIVAPPASAKSVLFVHSFIDDMKLKPMEFRIYAHLSRRADKSGKAWPGMRSIAKVCGCDRNSVATAINGLVKRNLLRLEKGARNANVYSLTSPFEWLKNSATTGGKLQPVSGGIVQPQGNPEEGNPLKEKNNTASRTRREAGGRGFDLSIPDGYDEREVDIIGNYHGTLAVRRNGWLTVNTDSAELHAALEGWTLNEAALLFRLAKHEPQRITIPKTKSIVRLLRENPPDSLPSEGEA